MKAKELIEILTAEPEAEIKMLNKNIELHDNVYICGAIEHQFGGFITKKDLENDEDYKNEEIDMKEYDHVFIISSNDLE